MEEYKNIQEEKPATGNEQLAKQDDNSVQPQPVSEKQISLTPEQPETKNPKPETDIMEVHHHGHVHEKKKWKEYLFQFLMLFLAVFCGFFAEYQLEHKIEGDRVEKYMHDMVENLKYDTTRIGANLPSNRETRKDLDSFRYEIKTAIGGQANSNRLYYYSLKINEFAQAAFNKSAITQLKNSGQLRLIKNDALVNEMLDYYERKVYAAEMYEQEAHNAFKDFTAGLNNVFSTIPFDFVTSLSDSTYSRQMIDDYKRNLLSVLSGPTLQLLSTDKASLEKLHTVVMRFETALINYNRFLNYSRQGAEKLMLHIEEVY